MDELAENGYGAHQPEDGGLRGSGAGGVRPDPLPEPPPGYWFQPRENLSYVTPDVLVLPGEDEELEVQVNGGRSAPAGSQRVLQQPAARDAG